MSKFFSSDRIALKAYVPGEQPQDGKYIKLNTNESPYQPAPEVLDAINRAQTSRLNLYPDTQAEKLRELLAGFYGLKPDNFMAGNGSDEILSIIYLAFGDSKRGVAFPNISYGFYEVYADLYNMPSYTPSLNKDFTINPPSYFNLNRLTLIANPNAPTGLALSRDDVISIVKNNPDGVVVIDEAYVDFGGETVIDLVNDFDNLIVVQTYSKSRSLAGARLGYAAANENLIEDMNRVRFSLNPYNINRITLAAGEAAISADKYYKARVSDIVRTRDITKDELVKRGFIVTDSSTNFLFASSENILGEAYYEALKAKGVLIRHFSKPEIADWNRISIGTDEDMRTLIDKTDEILRDIV